MVLIGAVELFSKEEALAQIEIENESFVGVAELSLEVKAFVFPLLHKYLQVCVTRLVKNPY